MIKKKYIIRDLVFTFGTATWFFSAYAFNTVPELIDLELTGGADTAYFNPQELNLEQDILYLLVLKNPYPSAYKFQAPDFTQAISTQSINGSPGVSLNSVQIAPQSRVQWIFRAKKAGEYSFQAISYGMTQVQQKAGVIHIRAHKLQDESKKSSEDFSFEPNVKGGVHFVEDEAENTPKKGLGWFKKRA